jgi:hypothetical protein
MVKKQVLSFLLALVLTLAVSAGASARWSLDLETGAVFSGYNNVRIPRSTGTLFSLSRELSTDPGMFFRAKPGISWGDRHAVTLLVAPLRLKAQGQVNRPLNYEGTTFPAFTPLSATYRFDTYRYDFLCRPALRAGLGITAKIRDAAIGVEGGGQSAEKKNTGFVPLMSFRTEWTPTEKLGILLDGDAAWAPQGRAEDVLLALQYRLGPKVNLKAGYRILEGGADVEETYNFTLIHYLVAGIVLNP